MMGVGQGRPYRVYLELRPTLVENSPIFLNFTFISGAGSKEHLT
jgi:hypothetical protein